MPSGSTHPANEPPGVSALRRLYRQGKFLMADEPTGAIHAYEADPRALIPLRSEDGLRVPRSLLQRVRSRRFVITADAAFGDVVRACAQGREEGTWISPEIVDLYTGLHRAGPRGNVHAHSIEAWLDAPEGRTLVAGLYGVAVGAVFCGESMFSRPELGGTDGSKVCLVHLIHHLVACGFEVLDAQIWNPHLDRFGCVQQSRTDFQRTLRSLRDCPVAWLPLDPERAATSSTP